MIMLGVVRILLVLAGFFFKENLPLQWLAHYAAGSGRVKRIPTHLIYQVEDSLNLAIERGMYNGNDVFVHHSTLYQGYGFVNRPTLFYLVGGFTAKYLPSKGMVLIRDTYDWHPAKEGQYFTSGFELKPWVHRILNLVLGDQYYPLKGFPMGNPGFSNKLWHDLEKVGARPFVTVGKASIELSIPQDGYTKINYKRLNQGRDPLTVLKHRTSTGKVKWTIEQIIAKHS